MRSRGGIEICPRWSYSARTFKLQSLISAAEIFKAPCQLYVASRRECLRAMKLRASKTEAGFDDEAEAEERSEHRTPGAGGWAEAEGREDERGGIRVAQGSDTTEFQKLRPTFSHAVYIYTHYLLPSPPPPSLPLSLSLRRRRPFCCSFQVLAIEIPGCIDARRRVPAALRKKPRASRRQIGIN